jgi:serine protease
MPRIALPLAVAALTLLCFAPAAGAAAPHATPERATLSAGDTRRTIDVKFVEGSDVRLRRGRLVSRSAGRIAALDEVFDHVDGLHVSRLFTSASEDRLAAVGRRARERSGRRQADMNLYFRVQTSGATDTIAVLDALNALDIVDLASPVAKPAPPPVTPSFVAGQGYRSGAAAGGIDADFAHSLAGGKGERVTVVDIEYSWNRSHEDLSKAGPAASALRNGTPCDPFAAQQGATDHGTSVLGELVGDANGFGVTGLVPGAQLRTVNAASVSPNGSCQANIANAIYVAADNTVAGDVILLEQQSYGPRWPGGDTQFGSVPVEWDPGVRTAIQYATALGRIVVEAAGNGSQDLDDPFYGNRFATDSGAIMVGAGNAPGCRSGTDPTVARGRLSFSNHGSTLDLQGWGNCVTTSGYGGLHGSSGGNDAYTAAFGGTSSASPIVAASAAVLSSVAEARGSTLPPATVRATLRATGQPQAFGNAGTIGPLPNLRAAIGALGPRLTEAAHVVSGSNLEGTTVPVQQSWTSSGNAAVSYDVWLRTDRGEYVKQTPTTAAATFDLERNHSYQFAARAVDANGVWSDWAYGTEFSLGEYQEDYSAANPAFGGSWTRATWQPAADAFVSVSGTAGDRATFAFSGSSVAWIATKATNRGQAHVYVDGVFDRTVDLYAATTSPQAVAFTRSWPQSGSHTIEIRVVGTAGRPKVDVDAFVRLQDRPA